MTFKEFLGNPRIVEYFKKAVLRKQLGHAYLFIGRKGVGKRTLAAIVCKGVLCHHPSEDGPCGICPSCRRFDSGNHPDFHRYGPDGLYFKIDVVRRIIHNVSLKPVESAWKCFLLEDVHLMRDEAANAFLKVLEEPPGSTLFFLIGESAEAILPTVRSRCQYFEFQPLLPKEVEKYLIEKGGVTAEEAAALAPYSHGSIERALTLNAGQYREMRDKVLAVLEAALTPRTYFALTDAIRTITVDREEMPDRLLVLEEVVRDLLLLQAGEQAQPVHRDLKQRLQDLTGQVDAGALHHFYGELLETREAILKINANIGLSLQALFLPLRLKVAASRTSSSLV